MALYINGNKIVNSLVIDGDMNFIFEEYLDFDNEFIILPYTLNSNHRIYVEFQLDAYESALQILGNSAGSTGYFYAGLWNGLGLNNFYVKTSDGEHYQVLSDYTKKNTLDVNNDGNVLINNSQWFRGQIASASNVFYTIGFRNAIDFKGKIYRFFIYDTVNDEYICDLRPVTVGNMHFLYDIINNLLYTKLKR